MKQEEGYICIFCRKNDPKFSFISFVKNWQKKLKEINMGLQNDPYYCYAYYYVPNRAYANSLFSIIDLIDGDLKVPQKRCLYQISGKKAYKFFFTIASLNGTDNNLHLMENEKNDIGQYISPISANIVATEYPSKHSQRKGIDKNDAIKLFVADGKQNNYELYNTVTFASVTNDRCYWANPDKSVLDDDWSLILNDYNNKILYLFNIPAGSLSIDDIPTRKDQRKPDALRIEIRYKNKCFPNIPVSSDLVMFNKFLICSLHYD